MANGKSGNLGTNFDGIFKLYFMDVDGNRELLAWADQSVSQAVLMRPRETPPRLPAQANYNDSVGTFRMKDVFLYNDGLKGIPRGTAKTLRVVSLHYRVSGGAMGLATGSGPSGVFVPTIFCPVSSYGASWEVKEVLGETKIYKDGSASFKVPARTPVYFQVLDSMGYCIATMRSWSTLMPGEEFGCLGCHENKLCSCPPVGINQADPPRKLETPLGIENKPFDFKQMVQPIFDGKCVSCHTADHSSGFDLSGDLGAASGGNKWATSYLSLLKGIPVATSNNAVSICTIFSEPWQQKPYSFGAALSGIMSKGGMNGTHHDVQVTENERRIVACWIDLCAPYSGKYNSYLSASDSIAYEKLLDNRLKWAAIEKENIKALLAATPVAHKVPECEKTSRSFSRRPEVSYLPAKHSLVLNKFSMGNFSVTDLRGRVMYRIKIFPRPAGDERMISLPVHFGTGVYVARFEGADGIRQAKISVTQ
jgi:hypothetical protein